MDRVAELRRAATLPGHLSHRFVGGAHTESRGFEALDLALYSIAGTQFLPDHTPASGAMHMTLDRRWAQTQGKNRNIGRQGAQIGYRAAPLNFCA